MVLTKIVRDGTESEIEEEQHHFMRGSGFDCKAYQGKIGCE